MTRKLGRPAPDDVRCPTCQAVVWRRLGERVSEVPSTAGPPELEHAFIRDGGSWDWTCERCGYSVKPASGLDNALTRAQPMRLPAILAGLLGLGNRSRLGATRNAVRTAQATVVATSAVVVLAVAATLAGRTPSPPASPPASAVPATCSAVVTQLGDLANARDGTLACGRVELTNVPVDSVTGDVTFWVGSGDERALVMTDEEIQPEAAVTVKAGQRVRIVGSVERPPPEDVPLSSGDRTALRGIALYVRAERVEIVSD